MNSNPTTIPCPVCNTPIPIEVQSLLLGTKFSCPQCSALIGIQQESVDVAKNAIEKFEELKQTLNKKQE